MSHLLTNFGATHHPHTQSPATATPEQRHPVRFVSLFSLTCVVSMAILGIALAEPHSNPWLLTWISPMCCVTNDCCWEISERELNQLPEDQWRVVATGQVRKRTDWSPDGRFYRCACDYNVADGKWIRHDKANTRCIFVPMRSAGISIPEVAR